jgi:hypothetical protein
MRHTPIHEGVEKLMQWHSKMDTLACKHMGIAHLYICVKFVYVQEGIVFMQ